MQMRAGLFVLKCCQRFCRQFFFSLSSHAVLIAAAHSCARYCQSAFAGARAQISDVNETETKCIFYSDFSSSFCASQLAFFLLLVRPFFGFLMCVFSSVLSRVYWNVEQVLGNSLASHAKQPREGIYSELQS